MANLFELPWYAGKYGHICTASDHGYLRILLTLKIPIHQPGSPGGDENWRTSGDNKTQVNTDSRLVRRPVRNEKSIEIFAGLVYGKHVSSC
jgi:hypothetical protein